MRLFLIALFSLYYLALRIGGSSTLPRLEDTEIIEIYHLRSFPKQLIQSSVGQFSLQIAALALRSIGSGDVIVLSFEPRNYSACFLPHILPGNNSLSWDLHAQLNSENVIDTQFWQQSTFLARMNGIVYKKYLLWLDVYQANNKFFFPQSICSIEFDSNCFQRSITWETFLSDSFRFFAALNVRINAMIPPRAKELRYITSSKPKLYHNLIVSNATADEKVNYQEVAHYFDKIMSCLQDYQLLDFTVALKSCIADEIIFIPLGNGEYYSFRPRYPYVYDYEFLQEIPDPFIISIRGINFEDVLIIIFLCLIIVIGGVAVCVKMKMLSLLFYEDSEHSTEIVGKSILQRIWISLSERNLYRRKFDEDNQELTALIQ